jgi:anti-anti-sigma factor
LPQPGTAIGPDAQARAGADLRGLGFMDSSGLRELYLANRRAHEHNRRMVVVRGSEPIDRVLDMVRADAHIETTRAPDPEGPGARSSI